MTTAATIANFFLDLATANQSPLTPIKVQKLVYLANGFHLAIYGIPLIDEQVEAWSFGPVIRSLYDELAPGGNDPIRKPIVTFRLVKRLGGYVVARECEILDLLHPENQDVIDLLHDVWDVYGKFTDVQLANLSHEPGSPWETVVAQYEGDPPRGA
jgi:uncharacterized phage-associated protein